MMRSAGTLWILGAALLLAACAGKPYPPDGRAESPTLGSSAAYWNTGPGVVQTTRVSATSEDTIPPLPVVGAPGPSEAPQVEYSRAEPAPATRPGPAPSPEVTSRPLGATQFAQNVQPVYEAPVVAGAAALRPGDEIEVRFFRNTELEGQRYAVGVGDVLRVDVVDHEDLSRDVVLVLPDGHISLPLVGSLRAAGKNVDELSDELAVRYARAEILEPQVQVAVTSSDRRLETLLNLQEGGGLGTLRIVVSRDGIITLPFIPPIPATQSMQAIVQQLRTAYWAEFGSRLEVTANLVERGERPLVYVMGEVTRPAAVEHESALNPLMAVAAAGGFLPTAEPEDVQVLRHGADGSVNLWAFDLEAGLEGNAPEAASFRLEPRDVVYVRQSGITKANIWMQQNIRNMLPFDVSTGVFFDPLGSSD